MGRLVVGGVLPSDGLPILAVVHEGIETVCRRGRRSEDHQLGVVAIAPNDFLAPITEKIGRKAWSGFGAVVGGRAIVVGR
jgi:hypothetical protein